MRQRQSEPLPGEEPWIPPPVDGTLRWPSRKIFGGIAKWSPYRGSHQPCETCVELIHERGVAAAPRPAPATRRRKGPNGDTLHCSRHAEVLERKDKEIARRVKAQGEAAEHLARGRRGVAPR